MTERRRQEETGATPDYFSILGVSEDAGQDEIEARYRELSDHLASASFPATLRDWAERQAALLDEAYAVLSDPDRRAELGQAARPQAADMAGDEPAHLTVDLHAGSEGDAAHGVMAAPAGEIEADQQDISAFRALVSGVPWKLLGIGAVLGVAVLGAFLFFPRGGDDGGPDTAAEDTGLAEIDTERVAELMALVQQDPTNQEATFELGEMFFLGGEWQAGIDWFTKLLEMDPINVHALTDVGTASFNLGNYEEAEKAWVKAKELDPNDVQVHYNLGFLYANVEPVNYAAALGEWQSVVDLAPGSDLANTAQVHLESLAEEAAGEASPAPTGAPGATDAPASP